jgi:hypothetical protein
MWIRAVSYQDAMLERLSATKFRLLEVASPPLADCGGFATVTAASLQ